MGYRSDVAAAFYADDKKDFPAVKLWLEENFPMKEWDDHITWTPYGMVFQVDNVKWYDSYPDVIAFEHACKEFISMFCDGKDAPPCGYEFVRIGEDYSDVDHVEEGRTHGVLYVSRSIEIEPRGN